MKNQELTLKQWEHLHKDSDEIFEIALKQQEYVDKLQSQLQQKENIIKEVREYIKRKDICIDTRKTDGSMDYVDLEKELLGILDKVD